MNEKNVHNIFESKDENALEIIMNLYGFMKHFEDFGMENGEQKDKSLNAHNCRKTAMQANMFLIYKLVDINKINPNTYNLLKNIFSKYAGMYIELISVTSDL